MGPPQPTTLMTLSSVAASVAANTPTADSSPPQTYNGSASMPLGVGMHLATMFSTFLSTLLSSPTSLDWIYLVLIGSVVQICRPICTSLWTEFIKSFWISTTIETSSDDSFRWFLYWISHSPGWYNRRILTIDTHSYPNSEYHIGHKLGNDESSVTVNCLPTLSESYSFCYKWHYGSFTCSRNQDPAASCSLEIHLLAWRRSIMDEFLVEVSQAFKAKDKHAVSIFAPAEQNPTTWSQFSTVAKRPMDSIILDPGTTDNILSDARDFLNQHSWYEARSIPFRRGYFLYGVPGSGKTSLIHALAGELGMEVHQIELSRPNMNDQTLKKLFGGLPSRCIALLEDIDAVFPSRDGPRLDSDSSTSGRPDTETGSRVTLSGLLNTLDGIGAREGRLLFGTSNYASRLDPALRRSGRFDVYVEFKLASRYQGEELFKRFYTITDSDQIAKDEKTSDEGTVAELEDIKVDKAHRLSPDVDVLPSCITPDSGKAAGDGESIEQLEADTTAATTAKDTGSDDQANERSPDIDASPSSTNADPCQAAGDEKTEQVEATTADDTNADDEVNERSLGMPSSTASSTPTSTSSTLVTPPETASVLTIGGPVRCFAPEVIKSLATQFGDAIPERQLPMSDLQGYLMMHKGDPEAAVLHAAAWAKEELERKRNMGDIISQNEPQA